MSRNPPAVELGASRRPTPLDSLGIDLDQGGGVIERRLLIAAGIALLLAVLASLLIQTRVTVAGQGFLLWPEGVDRVMSRYDGEVAALTVTVGARVEAGDVLVRLHQPGRERGLRQLQSQLQEAQDVRQQTLALQALQSEREHEAMEQERRAIRQQREAALALEAALSNRFAGESRALERGLLPEAQIIRTRSERDAARTEIARLEVALAQSRRDQTEREAQRERERLTLDQQVASLKAELQRLLEDHADASTVRAPRSGRVLELQVRPGQVIEAGDTVARVGEPQTLDGDLLAYVYLPAGEGKRVVPGMPVHLSPATTARNRYGYLRGSAIAVDTLPTSAEAFAQLSGQPELLQNLQQGGPPLQITVRLERDATTPSGYAWTGSRGPDFPLSAGTLVSGEAVIEKRPLLLTVLPFLQPRRVDRLLIE